MYICNLFLQKYIFIRKYISFIITSDTRNSFSCNTYDWFCHKTTISTELPGNMEPFWWLLCTHSSVTSAELNRIAHLLRLQQAKETSTWIKRFWTDYYDFREANINNLRSLINRFFLVLIVTCLKILKKKRKLHLKVIMATISKWSVWLKLCG